MREQARRFLQGAGDAWWIRNRQKPRRPDMVLSMISGLGMAPKRVVELGCGDGSRLERLAESYDCTCLGLDPSGLALGIERDWEQITKSFDRVTLRKGTATAPLPIMVDLIIFGFCLYLVDREDLFTVLEKTDKALSDGGYIIIQDFISPYPFSREYEHSPGILSYHMDHSKLWLAHPHYRLIHQLIDGEEGITVLQKKIEGAFPCG